jgi:hypothetical protein
MMRMIRFSPDLSKKLVAMPNEGLQGTLETRYGQCFRTILAPLRPIRYADGVPGEGNLCNPRSALKAALLPLSE